MPDRTRTNGPATTSNASSQERYGAARRAWRLHARPDLARLTKVDEVAGLLSWAIRNRQSGFDTGDRIGVAEAARALDTSRATLGLAIEKLRVDKLVEASGPRAPYTILPYDEHGPSRNELSEERISITRSVGGGAFIWPATFITTADRARPEVDEVLAALHSSTDPAVRRSLGAQESESARRWRQGELLLFRRLRHSDNDDGSSAWLLESTLVALPTGQLADLAAVIDGQLADLSLSHVFEVLGISGLRSGRTRILLGRVQDHSRDALVQTDGLPSVDLSGLLGADPRAGESQRPWLIRWEYGFFAAEPMGLVSYSVCHVLPGGPVEIYCRALTFDADDPGA